MSKTEIFEKLNGIFRDVFDDDELTVDEHTTASDVDGWDSLSHIMLLSAIEDEFDVTFDMKAVQGLKNVGEMAALIESLL